MFPQCFPVSHTRNIVSIVSFCFQDANYAYVTRQGFLTKIRTCKHLQKFCEHEQASTHLIFASNWSKILRALSNWMGPFDTSTRGFLFSRRCASISASRRKFPNEKKMILKESLLDQGKGGPPFSKLFRLDQIDPFSFRSNFPQNLVERIASLNLIVSLKFLSFNTKTQFETADIIRIDSAVLHSWFSRENGSGPALTLTPIFT